MAARSICVPARMVVLLLAGRGAASGPTVRTGNGTVVGTAHGAVDVFAGIRYARAPRFAAPVPVEVEGVVDATKFGPACLQWGLRERVIGAEECLTLNVFAPDTETRGVTGVRVLQSVFGVRGSSFRVFSAVWHITSMGKFGNKPHIR